MRSPSVLLGMLLASAFPYAAPALGHTHPSGCAHAHLPGSPQWHTCNTPGAACTPPNGGKCTTTRSSIINSARWCECVAPDDGCFAAAVNLISSDGITPAQNETISYSSTYHPDNMSVVNSGPVTGVAAFTDEDEAVEAFFTLEFGSSADPTQIPVDLHAFFMTYPALSFGGLDTGAHTFQLPGGNTEEQALVWDSTTGKLAPAEGIIQLEVANGLMSGGVVDVSFDATFDGSGNLFGSAYARGPAPPGVLFLDGFEIGDPSAWSASLGAVLLLGGVLGVLRRRRRAE